MPEDKGGDAYLAVDDKGQMIIRINLRTKNQPKVLCYGTLKLAEEQASIFFMQEQMREHAMKQKMGIINPREVIH